MNLAEQLFTTTTITDDRAQAWADCMEAWLGSRRSTNTRMAYARALSTLLASAGCQPWQIGRAEVLRWVNDMKKSGLAASTRAQSVAAVSSFFVFAMSYTRVDERGEHALTSFNPASGKDLRPKVEPYGKSSYFSTAECRALLRRMDRHTLQGARDYALFLGYLMTARRNSEWRAVRWGDFTQRGDQVLLHWNGKGKTDQALQIAPPVWDALAAYLRVSGQTLPDPDEYVFQPLSDNSTRLPTVDPDTWDRNRPISSREVGRLLKGYARRAGMDERRVNVHMLRHSAAMLRREAGDDIQKICEWLGHSSVAVTQIYMHKIEGACDRSWATVAQALGL